MVAILPQPRCVDIIIPNDDFYFLKDLLQVEFFLQDLLEILELLFCANL